MGSRFEISIWDQMSQDVFSDLQKQIIKDSEYFDQKYSRFIKDSFVRKIEGKLGEIKVDEDFMAMLKIYFSLYKMSEKKFNPLIGHTISDMGYDDRYTLIPKENIRGTPDLSLAVTILDDTTIALSELVLFDLGGVGKGYFVDKIAQFLREKRIKRFLVNGSGDIMYDGQGKEISCGLEHPTNEKQVIGTLKITQGSLCASGISRRNWGRYHHIINPLSLSSPSDILSTWVYADSAATADALATCLFLAPPENFQKTFSFEYCILDKNLKANYSSGFKAEFFY